MPHLVYEGAASPVAAVAPLVFLEEVLLAVFRRPPRGLGAGDLDDVRPSAAAQAAYRHDGRRLVGDAALDGRHQIGLVVDRAREPGHRRTRHELADEDDTASLSPPDVEAQVDLGERARARPGHAPHARVEEVESDDARERRTGPTVEL